MLYNIKPRQLRYDYASPLDISLRYHCYNQIVGEYSKYITKEEDYMSIERIAFEINYAGNNLLKDIFEQKKYNIDIAKLLKDKYGRMTYSELLGRFPENCFVNLEP
jgi:hypothetical protein